MPATAESQIMRVAAIVATAEHPLALIQPTALAT
jgi:2-succinyl-5-enolpyruvyl-6-hydroxy-3-cyclohexene-1-carboxylate synthase